MARVYRRLDMRTAEGKPSWCLDYVGLNGRRCRERTMAATKEEALALLRAKLTELNKARINGTSMERLTPVAFADFVEREYMPWAKATKRPGTYKRDQSLYGNVGRAFGKLLLRQITAGHVEKYMTDRKNGKAHKGRCNGDRLKCRCKAPAPATINRERTFLGKALNMALRRELIEKNPVQLVRALREDNARDRWMTHEEVAQLLKFSPDWLGPIVTVAVHTGMRESELVAMEWGDINWKHRMIRVDSRTSKTHKVRHVPINGETERALVAVHNETKRARAALRASIGPEGLSGPVFVNAETGKPFLATSVGHAFDRAAEAAGLRDVVFHTTRHTFASWCVQAGIPDRQIMAWIGHSSRHMLDRYAHLAPKAGAKALEAIADATLTASADEVGTGVAQDVAAKKAAV